MSPNLFCPGCGQGLPAGVAFCPGCGNAVPQTQPRYGAERSDSEPTIRDAPQPYSWMETPATPRPVVPLQSSPPPPAYQPPAARLGLVACPGCGVSVSRSAAFCPQCGRPQQNHYAAAPGFQRPQPQAFAQPAATLSYGQRSPGEQLLIIILAVIAASVILAFFC